MRERKYLVRIWDDGGAFYIRVSASTARLAEHKAEAWAKQEGFVLPYTHVVKEEGETQCQSHTD